MALAAAQAELAKASQLAADAQTRLRAALAAATAAEAAAVTAEANAVAAQNTINYVARNIYMAGGNDPRLSSTLELVTADDFVAAADSEIVMERTMDTHHLQFTNATRAVTEAKAAQQTAQQAAMAAKAEFEKAGVLLQAAEKATGFAGSPIGEFSAYATLYETLIGTSTMRWWDGGRGSVDGMCLKNAESVWTALGGGNENGMKPSAANAGHVYASQGKLHPYTAGMTVPRGMLIFWDESVGGGNGHVAVSDGQGNFINNFGAPLISREPLSSFNHNIIGWGPPTVFGHSPS